MSADEWDADDFEPAAPIVGKTDKWEGEDEGDDVKDSWDAEDDEEKKAEEDTGVKAVQRKKKKPLAERIAEKEAARIAKEQAEKEENRELTKEEKQAEAERLKKIQEESDLKLAKEAFGVDATGLDAMFPVTEEEFDKFRDALKLKISRFNSSKHYGTFIEKLMQDLIMDINIDDLKRISASTSSFFHEKQRIQKEQEKKKKKKSKGIVKTERDSDFNDIAAAGRGDYDDAYYDEDFI
ncbi:eukaryotic translation initiation factor 3 subunit J-B-like [Mercenaria mercenaria]|uniref:eukaryotic translation initiation factor 3 subunit J-B-like n=1 Tax=Mercenaria mercenaria TaxID=6596 RepID=UPI00234E5612|nr:eukaryotic translation initiation factor 3 subunit J-B-like [Mercenaria mercenaria]